MARDRQIFVRTTQEAYDWVTAQADAAGLSQGALVSEVLELAARQGWVLESRQIAVTGKPVPRSRPAGPPAVPELARERQRERREDEVPPVVLQEPSAPQAQTGSASGPPSAGCKHPGVGRKQRCPKCGRYNI